MLSDCSSASMDLHSVTTPRRQVNGRSHLESISTTSSCLATIFPGLCTRLKTSLLTVSGYHSHVGVGLLTAHGALIVHQKGGSPVDTNCPIPYDEERVFLVGDLFNLIHTDLVAEAANGTFIGGANVLLPRNQL